jgi:nucleotide-binding universal stress UspA family protein
VIQGQRKWAEQTLQQRVDVIEQQGVSARARVVPGVAVDEIVRVAGEEAADFIVMATHGHGALDRMLLGSVADRVIRLTPCPVMMVRDR